MLWNHPSSWGSMFVDCQDFAGLWRGDLVGNWFVPLQCITLLNVRGDVHWWIRVTNKIHEY